MLQDLRVIRQEKGLNQKYLSKLSSVSNSTISDIEYGKKIPRIDTVCFLAKGLSIEPKDLFGVLIEGELFFDRDAFFS